MEFSKKRKAEENGNAAPAMSSTGLTPEESRKLLQVLTEDQLVDVLQDALLRHSDVLDAVRAVVNRDTAQRKLFVRGLGADTTSETLRSVFASFGELDEAIVIFDKATAKSKGYGFVTFKNADAALLALRHPSKKIDGRITVTQFAAAGNNAVNSSSAASDIAARKVYVGNVPFEISSERLLSYFMMYGEIEEGPLGFDKKSGMSRGFAFFVYKTEEGARAALVEPIKSIDGHQLACKLAVDNKKVKLGGQATPVAESSATPVVAPVPHSTPFQGNQYGPPQGPGGLYYPGQGPPAVPGGHYGMNSSVGGAMGSQMAGNGGGFGVNFAVGYGPPSGDFAGRLPPSTGGYPEGSQYNLGSSGIHGGPQQHGQQPPVPRVPPGGMYQGLNHYY